MKTLKVVNIKCKGCEKSIISSLKKAGLNDIRIDHVNQIISFNGDIEMAKKILSLMGYPEESSKEAKSILKKARSCVSCVMGKMK